MNDFEWAEWRDKAAATLGVDCTTELRLRRLLDQARDLTVVRALRGNISSATPATEHGGPS